MSRSGSVVTCIVKLGCRIMGRYKICYAANTQLCTCNNVIWTSPRPHGVVATLCVYWVSLCLLVCYTICAFFLVD